MKIGVIVDNDFNSHAKGNKQDCLKPNFLI